MWQTLHRSNGLLRSTAYVSLTTLLVACGGGDSSSPPAQPPPPPQPVVSTAEAFRFANQATFGATESLVTSLTFSGFDSWIAQQLNLPPSTQLAAVQAAYTQLTNPGAMIGQLNTDRTEAWLRNALRGDDQLRQRVAFALSEIMVVSQAGALVNMPHALADYYDMLARNAFADYRKLIEDVTLHPAMGVYLSMLGNQKPDTARNIRPDENYARELMQLFAIGLVELNLDGSIKRDAQNQPIPTYTQDIIEGFAHVFTGWSYAGAASFAQARRTLTNQVQPMQAYAEQHATNAKLLLPVNGVPTSLPAGQTPAKDLADALDNIANHPNVAPFISKQLIQKLTNSNPSPSYISRIATVFNNDGTGRRGNLGAVVRAILLDGEARPAAPTATTGKLKEPLLRMTQLWRAFNAQAASGRHVFAPQTMSALFGQAPLNSPSVFNFFSPFYAPPGEIGDGGFVAPELQLATEYLNTQFANYIYGQFLCSVTTPVTGCPAQQPNTLIFDTNGEIAVASDATALVNRVAQKLLGGPPTATLLNEATAMVNRHATSNPAQRVADAIYLIASSPEFATQR